MQRQLTEAEVAWLAGLYEGEGTCYTRTRRIATGGSSTCVRVCICMTDEDVVQRVQDLFPSPSKIRVRDRGGPEWKPQYEWRISQRDRVAEFLRLILPLLGKRRTQQVLRVLAEAEDPNGGLGSGHRNKTHCRNGHPYDADNTHVNDKGHRNCRTCRRLEMRRRREALKECPS